MGIIDEAFTAFANVMGTYIEPTGFPYIYKQDADYSPGDQKITKWINSIWKLQNEAEGVGGEKRWKFTVMLELFMKSVQDVDTDNVILFDEFVELVHKGIEDRDNFDLYLQQGGIKIQDISNSEPYPFDKITPGRKKHIITFNCYILNRWT